MTRSPFAFERGCLSLYLTIYCYACSSSSVALGCGNAASRDLIGQSLLVGKHRPKVEMRWNSCTTGSIEWTYEENIIKSCGLLAKG